LVYVIVLSVIWLFLILVMFAILMHPNPGVIVFTTNAENGFVH
jgi:hypothetical protein